MDRNASNDPILEVLRTARHDFKGPLTSLRILAQLFKTGLERGTLAEESEKTERNCRLMIEQVDKLVSLADLFSDVSLILSGKLRLELQREDLRSLVELAVADLGDRVTELRSPGEALLGDWDTNRLKQALRIFVERRDRARVAIRRTDGQAVIALSGDYLSTDEEADPRLYLARTIIAMHGGTLRNRDEITLPLSLN